MWRLILSKMKSATLGREGDPFILPLLQVDSRLPLRHVQHGLSAPASVAGCNDPYLLK